MATRERGQRRGRRGSAPARRSTVSAHRARTRVAHDQVATALDVTPGRGAILAVLCVAVLVINLDGTILNVALPRIVATLHATSSQLQWIVDAYVIVLAGLLLIAGSLGDHLGRKWVFVGGLAAFGVGSALSAFAGTPHDLIGARAFMGVGAAAIMPSTLSILTNVFTEPQQRARAIGLWSGTNGLGLAIGPTVGGWLLAHYWWGSVFLINVPVALVTGMAALFIIPDSKNHLAAPPDLVGAGASLVGIGLLLWGIIEGPTRGWGSVGIVASLVGALGVIGALVLWERHSEHPLLEMSFFRARRFSVAMAGLGLTIFALAGAMFLLTQYLQFCLGYSALATGLRITPIAVVLVVVAGASSIAVRAVGTKVVVVVAMVLIAAGLAMLSALDTQSTYVSALPAFFLLGIGTGLAVAPCTDSVMGSVPLDLAGVGSATNSTALQIGSALGVAVLGSLLNTRYQQAMTALLSHYAVPRAAARAAVGSLGGAITVAQGAGGPLGDQLAHAARRSFVEAMGFSFTVGAVIVGAAALLVLVLLPARPSGEGSVALGDE
ncbi:MAG TPA: MFS transporter [Acidimicrobiales bacterium]|nr:MFS transporter [Acidimicrobiales bacterium]